MADPTRAALAERLTAHARWLREQFPGWAMQSDQRGTIESDIDAAAALLAKPEPSETNTLADRLNAASYDIEQHAPASEYATRAQVALADLRLWLTTEGAYPQVAPAPTDEEVARGLEAAWRKVGFTNFAPEQAMEIVLQVNAARERARRDAAA